MILFITIARIVSFYHFVNDQHEIVRTNCPFRDVNDLPYLSLCKC